MTEPVPADLPRDIQMRIFFHLHRFRLVLTLEEIQRIGNAIIYEKTYTRYNTIYEKDPKDLLTHKSSILFFKKHIDEMRWLFHRQNLDSVSIKFIRLNRISKLLDAFYYSNY